MKLFKAILLCFFITQLPIQNKIFYDERSELISDDFEIVEQPKNNHGGAQSMIAIEANCDLFYEYVNIEIRTAFYKGQSSWIWNKYMNQETLFHEQLHFKIAELYARKLRKHFIDNSFSLESIQENFYSDYKLYNDSLATYQSYFDSLYKKSNMNASLKLNYKINSQLDSLSLYKTPQFKIYLVE